VVPDEHLVGYQPRQVLHAIGEALPRAVPHPVHDAFDVEHLVADVPLDREIGGRDLVGEPLELAPHQILEATHGHRVVGSEVRLEAVERA
jgi:hypothetical protein